MKHVVTGLGLLFATLMTIIITLAGVRVINHFWTVLWLPL